MDGSKTKLSPAHGVQRPYRAGQWRLWQAAGNRRPDVRETLSVRCRHCHRVKRPGRRTRTLSGDCLETSSDGETERLGHHAKGELIWNSDPSEKRSSNGRSHHKYREVLVTSDHDFRLSSDSSPEQSLLAFREESTSGCSEDLGKQVRPGSEDNSESPHVYGPVLGAIEDAVKFRQDCPGGQDLEVSWWDGHWRHRGQARDHSDSGLVLHDRKRKKGDLPDKIFVNRRSVLTELFEISHIQTIYHIFVAMLIVFSINTIVYDIVERGTLNLNFGMIQWAFGKFPKVMAMWVLMQMSTLLVVYPAFYFWSTHRRPGGTMGWFDFAWIGFVIVYQVAFLLIPVLYLIDNNLPPASSVIITTEQTRLIMKTHAFIRENTEKIIKTKKDDDKDPDSGCPDFSKYLYFLFSPTLVYRDNYPRTQTISWRYVVTNFLQVLACLFYTYYIFERFCVPVFQNFNRDHISPKAFLLSVFGCMMPATLVLFIGFFAILHSWLNAFAEMLRFGDRLFYKDWWNSTTFSNYYRTWNVVVHDWLYTYIYKDVCKVIGKGNRAGAMACVFIISAVFHEYILTCTFKFFYPVLFFMFAGAGFAFIFLTDKGSNRSWNVFMWVALFIGNGLLMCLYSMEFYARQNCPATSDSFVDYLIPRSWFCDLPSSDVPPPSL